MNIVRRDFLSLIGKGVGVLTAVVAYPGVIWAKRNEQAFNSENLVTAISVIIDNVKVEGLLNYLFRNKSS